MQTDPARELVKSLMDAEGIDMKELSLALNMGDTYIRDYFKRGTPRIMGEAQRLALAHRWGRDPDEFRDGPSPPGQIKHRNSHLPVRIVGEDFVLLPVYDLRLSAGPGAYNESDGEPLHWEPYRFQWLRSISAASPKDLIIALVEGDSMEPTLRDGDQVLLDRTRTSLSHDGVYGYRIGDTLHVKRISVDPRTGLVKIISDNSEYPSYEGVDPDSLSVIGRVIWLGRRL